MEASSKVGLHNSSTFTNEDEEKVPNFAITEIATTTLNVPFSENFTSMSASSYLESPTRDSAEVAERYPHSTRFSRSYGRRFTESTVQKQSYRSKSEGDAEENKLEKPQTGLTRTGSQIVFSDEEKKKGGFFSKIAHFLGSKNKKPIELTFKSPPIDLDQWRLAFQKQLLGLVQGYHESSAEDLLKELWPPSLDLTPFAARISEAQQQLSNKLEFANLQKIKNPLLLRDEIKKLKKEVPVVQQVLGNVKILEEICSEQEKKYWLRRTEKFVFEMKIRKMEISQINISTWEQAAYSVLVKFSTENIVRTPKQIVLTFVESLLKFTPIPERIKYCYNQGRHLYPFLEGFLEIYNLEQFQEKLNHLNDEEKDLMKLIIGDGSIHQLSQLCEEKSPEWFGELEKNFCEIQKNVLKAKFKEKTKTVHLKASKFSEVKAKDIYEAYRAFYATCDGDFIQKSFTFNKQPLEKAPTLEKNENLENKRIEKFMEWLLDQFYTLLNVPRQFTNTKRAPSKSVLHSSEKEVKVVQETSFSLKQAEELLKAGLTQNKDPSKLLKSLKNSINCLLMLQCASNSAFPLAIELMQELVPHLWNPSDFTQVRLKAFPEDTIRFDFSYDTEECAFSVTQKKKFRLIKGETNHYAQYGSLDVHCAIRGNFLKSEELTYTLNFDEITFDEKVPEEIMNQIVELFFKP